jgi:hypothetical protein
LNYSGGCGSWVGGMTYLPLRSLCMPDKMHAKSPGRLGARDRASLHLACAMYTKGLLFSSFPLFAPPPTCFFRPSRRDAADVGPERWAALHARDTNTTRSAPAERTDWLLASAFWLPSTFISPNVYLLAQFRCTRLRKPVPAPLLPLLYPRS